MRYVRIFWQYSRSRFRTFLLLIAFAGFFGDPLASAQQSDNNEKPTFASGRATDYAPDGILVRFRTSRITQAQAQTDVGRSVTTEQEFVSVPGLRRLKLPEFTTVAEAIRQYSQDPDVLYAEPDYKVRVFDKRPNDPLFSQTWGLLNVGGNGGIAGADIGATRAWDFSTGSSGVVVGIIDSGVQSTHPDLAANLLPPVNMLLGDDSAEDRVGHGTHVAGTVGAAGNNSIGVAGVNWNVSILPCKFIGYDGSGPISAALACLDYIARQKDAGVNIVATNNSWGGPAYSQGLYDAIKAQLARGILFIVAAGNGGSDGIGDDNDDVPTYPANFDLDNVVAVAATDRTDRIASFSNFGSHSVALGAPGVGILSTVPDWRGNYDVFNGTSMATPHVTGTVALMKAWRPELTWWQIRNLLLTGGDSVPELQHTISGNRLNTYGSMTCTGRTLERRLQPRRNLITATIDEVVKLKVLNISCDHAAGSVSVTGPDGSTINLRDDGANGDDAAGDGIYSALWVPPALGTYTFNFPGNDVITVKVLAVYDFEQAPSTYLPITGTNLNIGDETFATLKLPFPVRFGGQTFDTLYIADNGYISFDQPFSLGLGFPIPWPSQGSVVAPFWDDLYPVYPGENNIFWDVVGTAPDRQLVVEWRNVPRFPFPPSAGTVTFETVFSEAKDDVLFNYQDVFFAGYYSSFFDQDLHGSVGLQVSPTQGVQFSFLQPKLTDGLSLLWTTHPPDFLVSSVPTERSVFVGQTATFNTSVTFRYGFRGDVQLGCSAPAPASCTGGTVAASSTGGSVDVTSSASTVGSYSLSLQAQGPAPELLTKTLALKLNVMDFGFGTPSVSSLTIPNGGSASFALPLNLFGPMTVPVTLSCGGLPPGASCSFSPSSLIPAAADTTVSTTVTVQLAPKTPAQSYALSVIATALGAPYSRSVQVPLAVQANPDFFLTSSASLLGGTNSSSQIAVDTQDGYTGTVNLGCAVIPAGPTCSITPTAVSAFPGKATLAVSLGTATAGSYTVTVTGSDGNKSHMLSLPLAAADFTVAADSGVVVYSDATGSFGYKINAINGYSGTVMISCDAGALGPSTFCFSEGAINMQGRTTWQSGISVSVHTSAQWTGAYPVVLTFTDPTYGLSHQTVTMVTPRGFLWTIDDPATATQTLYPGQASDPISFTVTPINGFNLPITFSTPALNTAWTPASVTPSGSPVKTSLSITGATLNNPYPYQLQGQYDFYPTAQFQGSSPVFANQKITVKLNDFALASPLLDNIYTAVLTVLPGHSNTFTVKYLPVNDFNQPVQIACPIEIGFGLHCSLDHAVLVPGDVATFTFSADAGTDLSIRNLVIDGVANFQERTIHHTVPFALVITKFDVALTPPSTSVASGGETNVIVNVTTATNYGLPSSANVDCVSADPGIACEHKLSLLIPGEMSIHLRTTDGVTPVGPHPYTVTISDWNGSASATGTIVMQPHDSIIVTAPNGGELWSSGTQAITWNYSGDPGPVRIELLKKGALDRVVADNVPVGVAGKGVYQWAIPDSLPFSQFYQIRVVGTNNPAAVDTSDTRVWIGQGVDINSPTTGDVVIQGGYILIDYTWSGVTKIKFDLYKAGQFLKNLQVAEISGYFDGPGWRWGTIGYTGTDTPFGPDYTIVATPVDDPTRAVTSKSFTIGLQQLNVVYPKGGEIWQPGSTQTVQWTWVGNPVKPGNEVSLMFLNSSYDSRVITLSAPIGDSGAGSYTFTVPKDMPPGTQYRIKATVYAANNVGLSASSPNVFAIGDFHTVTVNLIGAGIVNSADHFINCFNTCSTYYQTGKIVTLTVGSSGFTGWSGGGCSGTSACTFVVTQDVTIQASFGAPDFVLSGSGPAPAPVKAGGIMQFQMQVAGGPGFSGTISMSCAGLPVLSTCSFDKNNFTISTAPVPVTVSVKTTGSSSTQVPSTTLASQRTLIELVTAFLFGLVLYKPRSSRRALMIAVALLLLHTGCGGGGASVSSGPTNSPGASSTPAGTYTITVTASSGTLTHSMTVPMTVQ